LSAPLLGVVRWMAAPTADEAAASIEASLLPGWPLPR
jgi:hypothetical protein